MGFSIKNMKKDNTDFKLTIELVPGLSWGNNVRKIVSKNNGIILERSVMSNLIINVAFAEQRVDWAAMRYGIIMMKNMYKN